MRYTTRSEYRNWDEVTADVILKKIAQDNISEQNFLNDIETIRSVSHSNLFSATGFKGIIDDLNQIKYYDPDFKIKRPEIDGHAFISDIHRTAKLIKEASELTGSDKLFKANIFSHEGMFLQFLITVYISRTFEVVDLELTNKPLNSDIVIFSEEKLIHFSVKDCREKQKRERDRDAIDIIDFHFSDLARKRKSENFLAVKSISNSPPASVDEKYWLNHIATIEEKPQVIKVEFKPDEWPEIKTNVKVEIELDWRPWNSTHTSPTYPLSNQTKVISMYNSWEELVKKHGEKDEIYVIATITDDEYGWEEMESSLSEEEAGLLMVSMMGFYIQHSHIMLPGKYKEISRKLRSNLPAKPYWMMGVLKKI